jgi:hypothetical protein
VGRKYDAGAFIVTAVEPELEILREQGGEIAMQALQPRGPGGGGDAGIGVRGRVETRCAERGDGDAGIFYLIRARQRRFW